jgi:hypothetical protein
LQVPSGPQQYKDQNLKSTQGTQAAPDPYSLLGLLGLMRLKEPGPTSLALGIDLTTLGLNLNSQDNLYKTFGSPWSNEPAKGEPDYQIPACFCAEPPLALQVSFLTFWLLLAPEFLRLQKKIVPSCAAITFPEVSPLNIILYLLQVLLSSIYSAFCITSCTLFIYLTLLCAVCLRMSLSCMLLTNCK